MNETHLYKSWHMFGISQTHITYTSCCAQQNHVVQMVQHNTPGSSMGPGLRTLRISIRSACCNGFFPRHMSYQILQKSYQSASHAQGLEIVNAIRNCRIDYYKYCNSSMYISLILGDIWQHHQHHQACFGLFRDNGDNGLRTVTVRCQNASWVSDGTGLRLCNLKTCVG